MKTSEKIKALLNQGFTYQKISDLTKVPTSTLERWVNNPPRYVQHLEAINKLHGDLLPNPPSPK